MITHGWGSKVPDNRRVLLGELLEAVDSGRLHPVTPAIRPLEDAASVMADLVERRAVGKTVLAIN